MKRRTWLWAWGIALALALGSGSVALADDLELASQTDSPERTAAIARLRDEGPGALDRVLARIKQVEEKMAADSSNPTLAATHAALSQAADQIGGAKYCRASGLYWYTDLEKAQAMSRETGKPILALRMLGNLTDEFSCANSRFFRTTLYANAEVSQYLRDHYVLTWKSVRPVPKVTIDFGDGRKLERTITGNSIHYVLNSDGYVVDALPGLYGPAAFLKHLRRAAELVGELRTLPADQVGARLERFHREALDEIDALWRRDLQSVGVVPAPDDPLFHSTAPNVNAVEALREGRLPLFVPAVMNLEKKFAGLEKQSTEAVWDAIAQLHVGETVLDPAPLRLIGAQRPNAAAAGRLAITKRVVEDPLLRLVDNLRKSIAHDTVKNEYTLHRRLHVWLLGAPNLGASVEGLNAHVYAELFLMPSTDPWLGLAPSGVYTGLENNGVVTSKP